MARAQVTFTITASYELDPKEYEDGISPREMLDADIEAFNDDIFLAIETLEAKGGTVKIDGQLVGGT